MTLCFFILFLDFVCNPKEEINYNKIYKFSKIWQINKSASNISNLLILISMKHQPYQFLTKNNNTVGSFMEKEWKGKGKPWRRATLRGSRNAKIQKDHRKKITF